MIQCEGRNRLQHFLAERGIDARIHYPTPLHLQPCSADLGYRQGDLPVAEGQAQRILSLPVHQALSAQDIEYVAGSIVAFYRSSA